MSEDGETMSENSFVQDYVIGWLRDGEQLKGCSSGGAFRALAQAVLAMGGTVYGTQFTREKGAHVVGYPDDRVVRFSGSKYVKSDMNGALPAIRDTVAAGTPVLFCGTPCQCAAVRKFVGDSDRLYLVDIICHGAPRPHVLEAYLQYLEKQQGTAVTDICFRNKDEGWEAGGLLVTFADGSTFREPFHPAKNKYAKVFYSNIALTPACNGCRFNTLQRQGDLTIGDFWGHRSHPEVPINEDGTSVVLVNTPQGQALLEAAAPYFETRPVPRDTAIANNPPLTTHTPIHPMTERFCRSVERHGFETAYRRYLVELRLLLLPYKAVKKVWNKLTK